MGQGEADSPQDEKASGGSVKCGKLAGGELLVRRNQVKMGH